MNTCKRCGTEFEGKFCPECGQKWTDVNACPRCGNELSGSVKFCPECGCPIEHEKDNEFDAIEREKKSAQNSIELSKRIYGILKYVPMALALLFAVLLPLLYIAPIVEANEMLGAENINIYSLDEDFFGVSVAFLALMCLAFLLAAVLLFIYLNKEKRQSHIIIFGRLRIYIGDLVALSAIVLIYLPCLIISAVAMGQAAELNELVGGGLVDVVYAGAAPKAVLSFAVIFSVFAVSSDVARILLGKANPELLSKDENNQQAEVTPCRRPLLYYAYLNTKLRYAVNTFFLCTLITTIILMIYFFNGTLLSPHLVIIICSSVTIVAVIISMLIEISDWSPQNFLPVVQKKTWDTGAKLGIKKIIFTAIPLGIMIISLIGYSAMSMITYERSYSMAVVYISVSIGVYIAAKIVIAVQSGRIAEYLYGCAAPQSDSQLIIEYDEKHELELYKAYKASKKHGAVINGETTKKHTLVRRAVLAAACFAFVAVSVISAAVSPLFVDKFSASYVSLCITPNSYGYRNAEFEFVFGKPNEVEKDDVNTILIYYDDDYVNLKKQIDKAQKEHNTNRLQALNAKAANFKFSSLIIYCKDKDNLDRVILNTNTSVGNATTKKKTAKSVTLFHARYDIGRGYVSDGFYAEIFYTDGSYKYELVPISEFSEIDFNKSGKQTVKWSDEWGSYEATVKSA